VYVYVYINIYIYIHIYIYIYMSILKEREVKKKKHLKKTHWRGCVWLAKAPLATGAPTTTGAQNTPTNSRSRQIALQGKDLTIIDIK